MSNKVYYPELLQAKVSIQQKKKFEKLSEINGIKQAELFRHILNKYFDEVLPKDPIIQNKVF